MRGQGIEEPCTQLTRLDQQRATVHSDVKNKYNQGYPLSTLLSNSLLQYIVKPLCEKWNRDIHGVRRAEQDRDANRSNLTLAHNILLDSSSFKHHACLTTSPQPHRHTARNYAPANTQIIATKTSKTIRKTTRWQFKGRTSKSYHQKVKSNTSANSSPSKTQSKSSSTTPTNARGQQSRATGRSARSNFTTQR